MAEVHPEVVRAARELYADHHLDEKGLHDVLAGTMSINAAQNLQHTRRERGYSPNLPKGQGERGKGQAPKEPSLEDLPDWRGKWRRRMGRK